MPKGNRSPTNNARVSLTSQFLDTIRSVPNPKGIPKDFIIALLALQNPEFKKRFIEMHGESAFDEHIKRYSRNMTEMKNEKLERDKQKHEKSEEKLKLKKKELELREKELDIRQQNSSQRSQNNDLENLDDLYEEIGDKRKELKNLKHLSEDTVQKQYGKSSREVEQDLIIEVEVLDKKITEFSGAS